MPAGWLSIAKRFFLSCKLSFFHSIGWHAVQLELVLRPLGTCSQMTVAPTSTQGKALSRYGLVFFFLSYFFYLIYSYNIIVFPAMGALGFAEKINLKPGVFLLSFSMLLFRSCKQASNASPQPWKSILSECESPLWKKPIKDWEKPLRYGKPSGWHLRSKI